MKISLLNKREPFKSLFASTVKEALPEIYCMPFKVLLLNQGAHAQSRPHPGNMPFGSQADHTSTPVNLQLPSEADNEWICNGLLNAIYARSAEAPVRQATRGRYGNAPNGWRKILASIYVFLSTCQLTEKLLTPAFFRINPAPPGASMLLFRGGLNRIKLFDYRLNMVHVMPKLGTPPEWVEQELELRARLPANFPAPHVYRDFTWQKGFREELIPGITLDQIRDRGLAERAREKVAFHMGRLAVNTREEMDLDQYLDQLTARMGRCLDRRKDVDQDLARRVWATMESLAERIRHAHHGYHGHQQHGPGQPGGGGDGRQAKTGLGAPASLFISISHGDLQDDNILWTGENLVFTDWECIGHRQVAHDAIHYILNAHRPGFGMRLRQWMYGQGQGRERGRGRGQWRRREGGTGAGARAAGTGDRQHPGLLWLFTGGGRTVEATSLNTGPWRLWAGLLFLMEKLINHGESATNPVLFKPGSELAGFLDEIDLVLAKGPEAGVEAGAKGDVGWEGEFGAAGLEAGSEEEPTTRGPSAL